jgi:4-amino-4-deoxy-L-arabinose transferase-like glycosyltransferase
MQADVGFPDASAKMSHTLRDVLIVLALGSVIIFPSFFTRDPWNPDESRYVEVAREMVVLGDYVVPHLNGRLYPDKPPLFFWLAAGFYRAGFGFNSGRFVAAVAALGTLVLVYFFGRRLLPPPGGLLAAVITATTFLSFGLLKPGVMDPLLTLLTTTAFVAAYGALHGGGGRRALWLVFYGACGLAVLSKGPVGLLVPGIPVLVYAVLNRKAVSAGGWMHLAGAGLFVCIVGAWLVPAMIRGGAAYANDIVFKQQAVYTIRHESHQHGPQYYITKLPLYLLPWAFFAAVATAQTWVAWRKRGDRDAAFLVLWFVCIFALLTVVPAKRQRYLLPLMPAVGLICARYFVLSMKDGAPWPRLHKWLSVATFCIVGLLAVIIVAAPWVIREWATRAYPDEAVVQAQARAATSTGTVLPVAAVALLLLGVVVAGIRFSMRGTRPLWLVAAVLTTMVVISLFYDLLVVPLRNPVESGRYFAAEAIPYLKEADQAYLFGSEYSGVINLYTGILSIPVVNGDDREARMLKMLEEAASGRPQKIAVVTDLESFKSIRDRLPQGFHMAVQQQIGHRSMLLFCNWPVPEPKAVAP